MSWIAVKAFLGGVPREVYYGIAAVLLILGYGQIQYNKGKDVILERLEAAQIEAEQKAQEAIAAADESSEERALAHAATSSTMKKAITDAQNDDRNSIDALISSLSEAD